MNISMHSLLFWQDCVNFMALPMVVYIRQSAMDVFIYDNEATRSASISVFHRMSWWIINLCMFLSVTQW